MLSSLFVIFVLALFVGFAVVWRVTPALHSPLMSLTNAISSVIVLATLCALSLSAEDLGGAFYLVLGALFCCMVNIVGGFWMTQRMLGMFHQSKRR